MAKFLLAGKEWKVAENDCLSLVIKHDARVMLQQKPDGAIVLEIQRTKEEKDKKRKTKCE